MATRTKCSLRCLPASLTYCYTEGNFPCFWKYNLVCARDWTLWISENTIVGISSVGFLDGHTFTFCVLFTVTGSRVRQRVRACVRELWTDAWKKASTGLRNFCFRGTNAAWGHLGRSSLWGNALWPFFKTAAVGGWMQALESWLELASANNVNRAGRRTFNSWLRGQD